MPCQGAPVAAGSPLGSGGKDERTELRGTLPEAVPSRNSSSGWQEQETCVLPAWLGWAGPSWSPGPGSQGSHRRPEGQRPWRKQEGSPQQMPACYPEDCREPGADSFQGRCPGCLGPPGHSGVDWVLGLLPGPLGGRFCSALGAELFCFGTRPGTEKRGRGRGKKGKTPALLAPSPARALSGRRPGLLL